MRIGYRVLVLALLGSLLFIAIDLRGELFDLRVELGNADARNDRTESHREERIVDPPSPGCVADGPALRRLIREELRAIDARWTASFDGSGSSMGPLAASTGVSDAPSSIDSQGFAPPLEPGELELQLELVHQEIDLYLDQGEISNAEMAVLQSEIARLSPSQRVVAMRRLVAAINSGELDGRL